MFWPGKGFSPVINSYKRYVEGTWAPLNTTWGMDNRTCSIRIINAGKREVPRKELDGFISRAQELGAKGLVWAFREGDGWRSPTAKFLSDAELAELNRLLGAEEGDLLLLVADKRPVTDAVLGQMRLDLGERFGLIDESENSLVWIVDFPMFLYDEAEKRWDAVHHPFTAPKGEFDPSGMARIAQGLASETAAAASTPAFAKIWSSREDEAIAQFREAVRVDANLGWSHYFLAVALEQRNGVFVRTYLSVHVRLFEIRATERAQLVQLRLQPALDRRWQ